MYCFAWKNERTILQFAILLGFLNSRQVRSQKVFRKRFVLKFQCERSGENTTPHRKTMKVQGIDYEGPRNWTRGWSASPYPNKTIAIRTYLIWTFSNIYKWDRMAWWPSDNPTLHGQHGSTNATLHTTVFNNLMLLEIWSNFTNFTPQDCWTKISYLQN